MKKEKEKILNDIKFNNPINYSSWEYISIDDLLSLDKNGISYLEYACLNKIVFPPPYDNNITNQILNNLNALYICAKNNYLSWIYIINNEDIFFEKIDDNQTLIEYIFKNKVKLPFLFILYFKKRYEIIKYIYKYCKEKLSDVTKEIIAILLTKKNGTYPLDEFIDIPDIRKIVIKKSSKELLLSYCKDKDDYRILKYAEENILLEKLDNDKLIIEILLDNYIDPLFYNYDFKSDKILNILINRNRLDLLYKADISILLSNYKDNYTYLELLIDQEKQGKNVNLEKISNEYQIYSSEMTAKKLLLLAQNDMQGYVPEITTEMLLYKGKKDKYSIIEWLIEFEDKNALSKIISCCRKKEDPSFIVVLKNLGINHNLIDYQPNEPKLLDEFIRNYNQTYTKDCQSICPELLEELKDLFYQDGISEEEIINTLIDSYTYLTSVNNKNNKLFELEVKKLIEIKKNNPYDFTYLKSNEDSYFSSHGGVYIESNIIGVINHETSHAIHYYSNNYKIPDKYFQVIERARNNPNITKEIQKLSKIIKELKEKEYQELSKLDIESYYKKIYQGDKLLQLSSFLNSSKEEQRKKFEDNYSKPVLDTILAETFTVDEYIKQRINIEKKEIVDAAIRNKYPYLIAISDILDAVFIGKYRNGIVKNKNGEYIEPAYGHGIDYYETTNGFIEMIANYGVIIKSKQSEEGIQYLKNIVGDELVDMIKELYEENITIGSIKYGR